jgi:hypothetical protein
MVFKNDVMHVHSIHIFFSYTVARNLYNDQHNREFKTHPLQDPRTS